MNCVDINSPHKDSDAVSGVGVTCGQGQGQGQVEDGEGRDPVTGLSAKDRQAIRCSWALVSQDLQTNGSNFMIRFFTDYPENQASFTEFRDVSLEELRGQEGLREHAMRVMKALTAIVDSIDDAQVLVNVLHKTVDSHVIRGIRLSQFTELLDVFSRFLADSLGAQFTDDMSSAWQIAVGAIQSVVQARVQEYHSMAPAPQQQAS